MMDLNYEGLMAFSRRVRAVVQASFPGQVRIGGVVYAAGIGGLKVGEAWADDGVGHGETRPVTAVVDKELLSAAALPGVGGKFEFRTEADPTWRGATVTVIEGRNDLDRGWVIKGESPNR